LTAVFTIRTNLVLAALEAASSQDIRNELQVVQDQVPEDLQVQGNRRQKKTPPGSETMNAAGALMKRPSKRRSRRPNMPMKRQCRQPSGKSTIENRSPCAGKSP
jgi:hypothetical protein